MNVKNFKKWGNWLEKHGFKNLATAEVFGDYEDQIKFSSACSHSETFIKERFFMFFSDDEIKKISERIAIEKKSSRKSAYDPFSVSKKLNISLDEAKLIVEERKLKTRGTLENFIERHGEEEGIKKFNDFCERSKHTEKTFILKYGESEGPLKWNEYLKSKATTKQRCIEKLGEESGLELWNKIIDGKRITSSRDGISQKYGDDYYNSMSKRRTFKNSLPGYVEKYGEDVGNIKWKEHCQRKDSRGYNAILKRLNGDEDEARKVYSKYRMQSSPIFSYLKSLHGEEKAEDIYLSRNFEKKDIPIEFRQRQPNFMSARKGCVSLSANNFFSELEAILGYKLQYGEKKNELKLFNEEKLEIYYYDCFCPELNTVIEFNGSVFHPREGQYDFVHAGTGGGYKKYYEKDKRKLDLARSKGYNVYVVWDDEIKVKHEREKKLNFLKEELKENESYKS